MKRRVRIHIPSYNDGGEHGDKRQSKRTATVSPDGVVQNRFSKTPFDIDFQQTGQQAATWRIPGKYANDDLKAQERFVREEFNSTGTVAKPYTLDIEEAVVYATPESKEKQKKLISEYENAFKKLYQYGEHESVTLPKSNSIKDLEIWNKEASTKVQAINKQIKNSEKEVGKIQKTLGYSNPNDVLSEKGLSDLRSKFKKGDITEKEFMNAYNKVLRPYDPNNVELSTEDKELLKRQWYGTTDDEGRVAWMSDPRNVAKVAKVVAVAAPLVPFAPTVLANPMVQGALTAYGAYDAVTNSLPLAFKDFKAGRYGEGFINLGTAALDLAPIPAFGDDLLKIGKSGYNKVATGNSILPYAWKLEKPAESFADIKKMHGDLSFKNGSGYTQEEQNIMASYVLNPFNTDMEAFRDIIAKNPVDFSKISLPISRVEGYYAQAEGIPSKIGSVFSYDRPRSWSTGYSERALEQANSNRTRLVIPSKYAQGLDFSKVDYDDLKLQKGFDKIYSNKYGDSGLGVNTKIEPYREEVEVIGNAPLGYKVIGRTKDDGFNNLIIKPIREKQKTLTSKIKDEEYLNNLDKSFDTFNPVSSSEDLSKMLEQERIAKENIKIQHQKLAEKPMFGPGSHHEEALEKLKDKTTQGPVYANGGIHNAGEKRRVRIAIPSFNDGGLLDNEVVKMQQGGTVSQIWTEYTGTPWSEAKNQGLTDGSYEQNIALSKRVLAGEFGQKEVKDNTATTSSPSPSSSYDNAVTRMVSQGKTLDDLVQNRIGTKEGLTARFPELFAQSGTTKNKQVDKLFKHKVNQSKPSPLGDIIQGKKSVLDFKTATDILGNSIKSQESFSGMEDLIASKKNTDTWVLPEITKQLMEKATIPSKDNELPPNYNPNMTADRMKSTQELIKKYDEATKDLPVHIQESFMDKIMGASGEAMMTSPDLDKVAYKLEDYAKNASSYANRLMVQWGWMDADGEELDIVQTDKVAEVKQKPEVFYEEIKTQKDTHNKAIPGAELVSYRNQWDNETGQTFYNTPVKSHKRDLSKTYEDVIGVGHFILDASPLNGSTYMHGNNFVYIKNSLDKDEYIPVFENIPGTDGEVNMKYKKPSQMNKEELEAVEIFSKYNSKAIKDPKRKDEIALEYAKAIDNSKVKIVAPLRQVSYDNIDFSSSVRAEGFANSRYLKTKDGGETKLLFTNIKKNVYGRFDGVTVSFIFTDKYGNSITRDYTGSIKGIEEEGKSIKDKYKLKDSDLKVGYQDVGSFSAKPSARGGKLSIDEFDNYNNKDGTGSALIMKGVRNEEVPTLPNIVRPDK